MATFLYRLGKTAYRRWPLFLAAWLVALSVWTEWHAAHHAAPDPCA